MVINDLLIRNGLVVDGMGGKPFVADLAVKEDQIVAIGQNLGKSVKEIDAKDHIVTPEFIFPLGNGPKPNYVDGPNKSLSAISEKKCRIHIL